MRRTLKVLGLIGVTAATGVAAARRLLQPVQDPVRTGDGEVHNVSNELRRALSRFEDRFGT